MWKLHQNNKQAVIKKRRIDMLLFLFSVSLLTQNISAAQEEKSV